MASIMDRVKDGSRDALSKTKSALGIEKENPTVVDEISENCPKLTYQQVCATMIYTT